MNNIRQYSSIDYILEKGKYELFLFLINKNVITYQNKYITIATDGYKQYYNRYGKHDKKFENSYQFKSYVDLTQLLLKNCMNFKKQDYINGHIKHLPNLNKLFL